MQDEKFPYVKIPLTYKELQAYADKLLSQLPEGMKHCTIVFKECPKGHGRLTASNWVDHGCLHCEIEELKAMMKIASDLLIIDDRK